jgi:TolB-like protein
MKKIYAMMAIFLFALQVMAQKTTEEKKAEKVDVILKTNGDELLGKVVEITDDAIKFNYEGETLAYFLKKSEVLKITYGSGRIEFFNRDGVTAAQKTDKQPAGLEDHHNKVAILPFGFVKDNQEAGDEMGYKVQSEVFTFLSKHSAGLTILEPRTTNALLSKAGISKANLMDHTYEELAGALGVEYLVDGTVTQNKGVATTTTNNSYSTSDTKNDNKKLSGYSSTINQQTFISTINLNISTDKNTTIYSKTHRGLLASTDGSYNSPLEYLLKRCPLYKK